jgi:hypothetical protein
MKPHLANTYHQLLSDAPGADNCPGFVVIHEAILKNLLFHLKEDAGQPYPDGATVPAAPKFRVLREEDINNLERAVQAAMAEGWELQGGVCFTMRQNPSSRPSYWFAQALVRHVEIVTTTWASATSNKDAVKNALLNDLLKPDEGKSLRGLDPELRPAPVKPQ